MGSKNNATMHKNNCLPNYIYSIATLKCKDCLMFIKIGQLQNYIKLCKIRYNSCVFRTQSNICGGPFL